MRTIEELDNRKIPIVTFDPVLEQDKGKIFFPEKLQKANEMLKQGKLPANKNSHLEALDSYNPNHKD
jgi:hypothetical protein